MAKVRELKIYGEFQRRKWEENGFFPQIKLTGAYLEKAGFQLGKQIFVTVEQGKLIIQNEQNYAKSGANR